MDTTRATYLAVTTSMAVTLLAGADAAATRSASRATPTNLVVSIAPTETDPGVPTPDVHWQLDGDGDALVGDARLAFSGGYKLTQEAVAFDGVTGFAATTGSGPVVTTDSFSVAAWVNLGRAVDYSSAVSQLGEVAAAFGLFYLEGSWGFFMKSADTNEPESTVRALSAPMTLDPAAWVHLVGVYDADTEQIRLYVDGQPAAATAFTATWQAEGPLTVGRSQAHAAPANFWPGAIDDVRIYSAALDDTEVQDVYRERPPTSPPPSAPISDPNVIFRLQRDEICRSGSQAVAAINAEIEGAAPADFAAGLRRIAEQAETTYAALDELDVPESWAQFVEADTELRAEGMRLFSELIDAIEREDTQTAETIDQQLTELHIAIEAAEDEHGLAHC